jgi:glutaredoxin
MLTVYTQPNCNFCSLAVQILANNDIPFEIIDIKAHPEAGAFLKSEGHKTVPQIYCGDVLFVEGGYEGLRKITPEELSALPDLLALDV